LLAPKVGKRVVEAALRDGAAAGVGHRFAVLPPLDDDVTLPIEAYDEAIG